jgi:TolB-like protein
MADYVFISYASADQETANRLVDLIEKRGIPCWIASRDIRPGEDYQNAIVHALEGAGVFLLLFSQAASESTEIPKELALAGKFKKSIIPARLNDIVPSGPFAYQMTSSQFIDLFVDFEAKVDELCSYMAETLHVAQVTKQRIDGEQRRRLARRNFLRGGIGALALLVVAGIGFTIVPKMATWRDILRSRSTAQAPAPAASAAKHTISSIAVLPFDNFSGDPNQEYFSDGMTDELTTALATISALRVISRGSVMRFKGPNKPPTPEIGKLLNVDAVVEGSVVRLGDKVRVTAQLIDAPADKHLWAKSYERNSKDVLAMQDELASAIAKEVNVELTPTEQERLTTARVVNPAAHDAYLKGRYFFSRITDASLLKAIDEFNEAIRLDPNFAPAYAGLSDTYNWAGSNEGVFTSAEAAVKGEAAARRAVQLDDNSAESHTALAGCLYNWMYDWKAAEAEFRRAIALNPSYSFAHDMYSQLLATQGRLDEALAESQRAAELDPLSIMALQDMAWSLAWQGKYDAAADQGRKIQSLDATSFLGPWTVGWTYIQAGRASDAVTEWKKSAALESPSYVLGYLGYAYGASGDRVDAMAQIGELNKRALRGYVPAYNLALVHLGMGDHDRAMASLEKSYEQNSQLLTFLKMDRIWNPLRKEPRFIALLKKLNFEK